MDGGLSLLATMGASAKSAGALSTAATAFSVGSSLLSGLKSFQAGRAEEAQLKQQAQAEKLRAQQEESDRQARLAQILSAQMAQTAGRGIQVGSGSDLSISRFSESEAQRESDIASLDSLYRQSQLNQRASQARTRATSDLISGVGRAASTYMSAAERRQQMERTK